MFEPFKIPIFQLFLKLQKLLSLQLFLVQMIGPFIINKKNVVAFLGTKFVHASNIT